MRQLIVKKRSYPRFRFLFNITSGNRGRSYFLSLCCRPYEFFLLFPFHLQDPHPFSLIFGILVEDERKSKKKSCTRCLLSSGIHPSLSLFLYYRIPDAISLSKDCFYFISLLTGSLLLGFHFLFQNSYAFSIFFY